MKQCFDELNYTIDVNELQKYKKLLDPIRRVKWGRCKQQVQRNL